MAIIKKTKTNEDKNKVIMEFQNLLMSRFDINDIYRYRDICDIVIKTAEELIAKEN